MLRRAVYSADRSWPYIFLDAHRIRCPMEPYQVKAGVPPVPNAAVVATLTSSHLEDYASLAGEEMQERLSKVVGRTENIVTRSRATTSSPFCTGGCSLASVLSKTAGPRRKLMPTGMSLSATPFPRATGRPATETG